MAEGLHPIVQAMMAGERDRQRQADLEFRQGYQVDMMEQRWANFERQSKLAKLKLEAFEAKLKQENLKNIMGITEDISEGTVENVSGENPFIGNIINRLSQGDFRPIPQQEIEERDLASAVEKRTEFGKVDLKIFEDEEKIKQRSRERLIDKRFVNNQWLLNQQQINRVAIEGLKMANKAKEEPDGFSAKTALDSIILNQRQFSNFSRDHQDKINIVAQTYDKGKQVAIPTKADHTILRDSTVKAAGVISQLESMYNQHGAEMGKVWPLLLSKTKSPFWATVLGGKEIGDYVDKQLRLKGLAIQLWTAVTGEKGRFSETDQRAADSMLFNPSASVEINRQNGQKVIQLMILQSLNARFSTLKQPLRQELFDTMGIDWLTAGKVSDFSVAKYENELEKRTREFNKFRKDALGVK